MNAANLDHSKPTRRHFCCAITAAAVSATLPSRVFCDDQVKDPAAGHSSQAVDADEAMKRLFEGNQRFADGKSRHPHEARDWRLTLESGQHPFAAVLGCADSRACPELLFDQGFGDLFVVRVAGNIVDVDVAASLEYAVDHLDTKLVVVLGHSNCGAVTATLDHLAESATEPDEIVSLLYRIEPALDGLPQDLPRQNLISLAVEKNVRFAVKRLTQIPDLRKSTRTRQVRVVGAVYDMHTGKTKWLDS